MEPENDPAKPKSAKIRAADLDKAAADAERLGSNRMEIVGAWRVAFETAPEKRRLEYLQRVRRAFPSNSGSYRRGRGNRKIPA